jgi:hypothetical protein
MQEIVCPTNSSFVIGSPKLKLEPDNDTLIFEVLDPGGFNILLTFVATNQLRHQWHVGTQLEPRTLDFIDKEKSTR